MKIAVIIKHPFRDNDWRVDIMEVPEDETSEQIERYVMSKMLGPFQIIAITTKIELNRFYGTQEQTIIGSTDGPQTPGEV